MPITYQYETLATLRERAKEEVGKVVVGQGRAVELLLIAAMVVAASCTASTMLW